MAYPGTGAASKLGMAVESTWGTYVAPTHAYLIQSESLKPEIGKIYSRAINDRYQARSRVRTYVQNAGGQIDLPFQTRRMGLFLSAITGSTPTVTAADGASGAAQLHNYKMDDDGLIGVSRTIQVARPYIDVTTGAGTLQAHNFVGGKIISWSLSCALDAELMLSTVWNFKNYETTSTLATYDTGTLRPDGDAYNFSWADFTAKIADVGTTDPSSFSTTLATKSFKLDGQRAMNTDRRFLGGISTKRVPVENGEIAYSGALEFEYDSTHKGYINDYIAGTQKALLFEFALPETIATPQSTHPYKVQIILPAVEFTSDVPVVNTPDVLPLPMAFKVLKDSVDEFIEFNIVTSEETYNEVVPDPGA